MNIPVFVVGSVGGCSSEVALEYKDIDWHGLNNAPKELNQKFLEEINYFSMAQEMINYINQTQNGMNWYLTFKTPQKCIDSTNAESNNCNNKTCEINCKEDQD